jgi:serine/threonine protein kinase
VTELLQGTTLAARIAGRPMRLADVLDVSIQVVGALAAAHAAGIVHRDIKPQNIFVTRSGAVKLLDFGIARLVDRSGAELADRLTVTLPGVLVGTPAYMAPEQIRGQAVDARTDIFAFGCVLHEMLTGAGPFVRASVPDALAAILSDVPVRGAHAAVPVLLERVLDRCLQKDPSERFQTAADLRFALEVARDAAGLPHPPATPAAARRGWGLAALFGATGPYVALRLRRGKLEC